MVREALFYMSCILVEAMMNSQLKFFHQDDHLTKPSWKYADRLASALRAALALAI